MPQNALFVGFVDALNGNPDDDGRMQGETVLCVMHDEEMVRGLLDLNPSDYQIAIDAHRQNQFVKLRGTMHPGRRIHRITNVSDFALVQQSPN